MALQRKTSQAAYFLVDLMKLHPADRQLVMEDAAMGGADFGVRIVEVAINGPAERPIYGVYSDGEDHEKWKKAKESFTPVDGDPADDVDEDALREQTEAEANDAAERQRLADEAAVTAITGDKAANKAKRA